MAWVGNGVLCGIFLTTLRTAETLADFFARAAVYLGAGMVLYMILGVAERFRWFGLRPD